MICSVILGAMLALYTNNYTMWGIDNIGGQYPIRYFNTLQECEQEAKQQKLYKAYCKHSKIR